MRDSVTNSGTTAGSTPAVKTVTNAMTVLRAFGDQGEWGVSELARALDMNKSVVHRLLNTLVAGGMLERTAGGGTYGIGVELIRIARQAERHNPMIRVAHAYLEELATATGDSCTLAVLRNRRGLYADVVAGTQRLRFSVEVGESLQLHAGAGGKALLAYQSDAFIDEILADDLEAYTESTITDPDKLREELAEIRAAGYAFSDSEVTPGTRSVAAAVRDNDGRAVATLIVTAVAARMPDARLEEFGALLSGAARRLEHSLGYETGDAA